LRQRGTCEQAREDERHQWPGHEITSQVLWTRDRASGSRYSAFFLTG
jgi:hypothetical protein